jgi:cysteine desulfurase/selenocysteine lyase
VTVPDTRLAERFRAHMPVADRWAYFDHAAVAPLPQVAADALAAWLREATLEGDTVWPNWAQQLEQTRSVAAALIHASPAEVALVPNTTYGLNLVARGFPWQPGDNVVVPENEFPSNLYAWLSLAEIGVETKVVPVAGGRLELERLLAACDERTRVIAVSWVGYASGWRIDVAELCRAAHARGILVMLDAIQGLGVFPLDVAATEVDFVAADGHKWLLGPEGAGIFYVRKEHLARLRSVGAGWNSVAGRYDFARIAWQPREEAARFEGGSHNMAGFIGLGASLNLLQSLGLSAQASPIADQILALAQVARQRLLAAGAEMISPHEPGSESGILTFRLPGQDAAEVRHRCLAARVALSVRGGGLRISLHGYNTHDDLDRLLNVLLFSA